MAVIFFWSRLLKNWTFIFTLWTIKR